MCLRSSRQASSLQLLLPLLLLLLVGWIAPIAVSGLGRGLKARFQDIWREHGPLNSSDLTLLRRQAWEMFDHGFAHYMKHAFPMDNLLPCTCRGKNWQGGLGLTLVDSLDTLALMDRRADLLEGVELLRGSLDFDKDVEVHVFETSIRVLGGLVSGHVLLERDSSLVPGYDGLLLHKAVELADRLLPAFDTPSGLPALFVNLRTGIVQPKGRMKTSNTCTACAGTLLLEFGMLSALTGNSVYMDHAHRCAKTVYEKRSKLGLVGSSLDVNTEAWTSRESTIGPGIDSYYEYLLKAYLMFGDEDYLEMFSELYASTMRWMTLPVNELGYSFLGDVNMDSGKLTRPFVSALGAFWPGMQALAGQEDDAVQLHANFTAAWRAFGWMPEMFGVDLSRTDARDPGYNLRPEHVESTYLLHCLTRRKEYLETAAKLQATIAAHNRARCGFACIRNVATGKHEDLQESFFLSETMKYLYFIFSDAPDFIDYYVLTTEGHIMPVLPRAPPRKSTAGAAGAAEPAAGFGEGGRTHSSVRAEADASLAGTAQPHLPPATPPLPPPRLHLSDIPSNCATICLPLPTGDAEAAEASLRQAYPLLKFARSDAALLRARRCTACIAVTAKMAQLPPVSHSAREERLKAAEAAATVVAEAPAVRRVLARVVCTLIQYGVGASVQFRCGEVRALMPADMQMGLPPHAVVVQLVLPEDAEADIHVQAVTVLVTGGGRAAGNTQAEARQLSTNTGAGAGADAVPPASLRLVGGGASFGPGLGRPPSATCEAALLSPAAWSGCGNARQTCAGWAAAGECAANPGYMAMHCAAACGICDGDGPQAAAAAAAPALSTYTCAVPTLLSSARMWWVLLREARAGNGSGGGMLLLPSGDDAAEAAEAASSGGSSAVPWACTAGDAAHAGSAEDGADTGALHGGLPPAVFAPAGPCSVGRVSSSDGSAPGVVWGHLVLADGPLDACMPPANAAELAGSVAVATRGTCSFYQKAMTLQAAGAAAFVLLNVQDDHPGLSMSGDGSGKGVIIPGALLPRGESLLLLSQMRRTEAWHMQGAAPLWAALVANGDPQSQPPPGHSAAVTSEAECPVHDDGADVKGTEAATALVPEPGIQRLSKHAEAKQHAVRIGAAKEHTTSAMWGRLVDQSLKRLGVVQHGDKRDTQRQPDVGRAGESNPQAQLPPTPPSKQQPQHQQPQHQHQKGQSDTNVIQPRLDMLVPQHSNSYVSGNVLSRGIDINALFLQILQDGRVAEMLSNLGQEALENMVDAGGSGRKLATP